MSIKVARVICSLLALLMVAGIAHAGGVDPKEMPPQEPVVREKVTATPKQTSTAVSKARRAVVPVVEESPVVKERPVVKEVPMSKVRPKAVAAPDQNSWMLGSREGGCAPLTSVKRKVKNIGTFKTPQEFAHQMQQRGYQAFALDIGDVRDQMMRVKVPDLDLDLTFVKAGLCR